MIWLRINVFSWRAVAFFSMALVVCLWVFPWLFQQLCPGSYYLDVRSVFVADAPVGTSPAVVLDRDIKRDFTSSYKATVRVIDARDGSIMSYCTPGIRDGREAKAGTPYPGRNLDWFLGSPPAESCKLTPGNYQLRIEWTIDAFFGMIPLHMTRESPPFEIYDPALSRSGYPLPWDPTAKPGR